MEVQSKNLIAASAFELVNQVVRNPEKTNEIISKFSIVEIAQATREELGLPPASFARLMAGIELGRRIQEEKLRYNAPKSIDSSSTAIDFCRTHFSRLIHEAIQEEFHIVTLNTKNRVTATHQITVGTLDASLVHPREVFRPAIKDAASSILLVHNHPSGDPQPSKEDIAVTSRLESVGELLGIDVLDHIIVGKDGCISIREAL